MRRHRAVADERFRVLFVCTGNICRSPFVEILTRHLLQARLGPAAVGGRWSVVECSPAGLGTTFAVREFARLVAAVEPSELPEDPVERAHALVDHARHRRGLLPLGGADADRVPDPMGGPRAAHHDAAVLLAAALEVVVTAITPTRTRIGVRGRTAPLQSPVQPHHA
ncbi:MAG: low molecular weight phosphatase family protein [Pseudonocardia sp.]